MTWQEKLEKSFNVITDSIKQKTIKELLDDLEVQFNQYKSEIVAEDEASKYAEFIKAYQKKLNEILRSGGDNFGIYLASLIQANLSENAIVKNSFSAIKDKTIGSFLEDNKNKFIEYAKDPLIQKMLHKFSENAINFGTYDGSSLEAAYNPEDLSLNLKLNALRVQNLRLIEQPELEKISAIIHELEHKIDFNTGRLSYILDNFSNELLSCIKYNDADLDDYKSKVIKMAQDISNLFDKQIATYADNLESKIGKATDKASIDRIFNHNFIREIIPNLMGLYYQKEVGDIENALKNSIRFPTVSTIAGNIHKTFGTAANNRSSNFYVARNSLKKKTENKPLDL